jgi:hypothetical protein
LEDLPAGAETGGGVTWGGAIGGIAIGGMAGCCGIAGGCMEGAWGMPIGGMPGICPAGRAPGGGGPRLEGTEISLVYSLGPCGGAAAGG